MQDSQLPSAGGFQAFFAEQGVPVLTLWASLRDKEAALAAEAAAAAAQAAPADAKGGAKDKGGKGKAAAAPPALGAPCSVPSLRQIRWSTSGTGYAEVSGEIAGALSACHPLASNVC